MMMEDWKTMGSPIKYSGKKDRQVFLPYISLIFPSNIFQVPNFPPSFWWLQTMANPTNRSQPETFLGPRHLQSSPRSNVAPAFFEKFGGPNSRRTGTGPTWRWVALKIMSHVPNFHHFTVNLENLGFEGLSFQGRL